MTGRGASVCDLYQRWNFNAAALHRERAARMECASARRIDGAGHLTLDGRLEPNPCRVRHRCSGDQRLRIRVHRFGEQRLAGRNLYDPPQIHDCDAVADMLDDAEIMRDKHEGDAQLLLQIHEQVQDLRLYGNIKRRDRLVEDDE